MKLAITKLTDGERLHIRGAVEAALMYWPNDGRPDTASEMIKEAFADLRRSVAQSSQPCLHSAAAKLENDAYRYSDM